MLQKAKSSDFWEDFGWIWKNVYKKQY